MSPNFKVKCHFVLKDHKRHFYSSADLLKPFGLLFLYSFIVKEILKFFQEISILYLQKEKPSESQQLYVIV